MLKCHTISIKITPLQYCYVSKTTCSFKYLCDVYNGNGIFYRAHFIILQFNALNTED